MCGLAYLLTQRPEAVVAVLVEATPCPLILATPVAIISGINRAARPGIVVKTGAALEQIGRTTAVAFDTTGTLTSGMPVVQRVLPLDGAAPEQVLRLAAGLEQFSGHQKADLLPAQKVAVVRELLARHPVVLMVGDGINDAPALAAATVGVAQGAHGAAVSAEAADAVITVDDVGRVADAVATGQYTLRIALQSIWIGLGVSGSLMVIAAFGYIPPTLGAVLQEVLDVAVILNALRAR